MATSKPKPETRPDTFERAKYMTVGEVGAAYGMILTAEKLSTLGFAPNLEVGNSKLYHVSLLPAIGKALSAHILAKSEAYA